MEAERIKKLLSPKKFSDIAAIIEKEDLLFENQAKTKKPLDKISMNILDAHEGSRSNVSD
jgi:hypothetical protein